MYLVKVIATGDHYAMKVLGSKKKIDKKELKNILNERKVFSLLKSNFCVSALGSFVYKSLICFVIEYVPGGDLYQEIFEKETFDLDSDTIKYYLAELVLGINDLHSKGIIHRDIKPANILIGEGGHLKLTDYGLSEIKGKMDRTIKGSLNYMAPETFIDGEIGFEVDWYALGVLAFFLIKERFPFHAETKDELISLIFKHEVVWEIPGKKKQNFKN